MPVWFIWSACERTPERPAAPAPAHASEWGALVEAAERQDFVTTKVLARDLTLGPVDEDHPAASKLGAALGYLQLAEPGDDLTGAVARARSACAECHAGSGVSPGVILR